MPASLPRLVRRTYGTPVYEVATGIESKSPILPSQLAAFPTIPTDPGYYILASHGEDWAPTDGLTYRERSYVVQVLPR